MKAKATHARIYLLTCIVTGKIYIGQTRRSINERWGMHVASAVRRGIRTHLAHAICKYGKDAFTQQLLEECVVAEANDRERFHIGAYRSDDRAVGYNMSAGGDGGNNAMSEEVRRKISATKTGVKMGPPSAETRRKISVAKKGVMRTPEQRERIRTSRKYGPLSAEHRENIRAGLREVVTFKLSPIQRQLLIGRLSKETDAQLAMAFGVSRKMLWRIRNNKDKHND
jgi:group I intron endonuclease